MLERISYIAVAWFIIELLVSSYLISFSFQKLKKMINFDVLDPDENTYHIIYYLQMKFIQLTLVLIIITRINVIVELMLGGDYGSFYYKPKLNENNEDEG